MPKSGGVYVIKDGKRQLISRTGHVPVSPPVAKDLPAAAVAKPTADKGSGRPR